MNLESRILRLRSGQVMNHGKLKPTIHRNQGFTLIELLIVIAVLGILAVGVLVAINVTGNLNKANLAKAKTFAASVENDLSIAQVGKWSFEELSSPSTDTSGYNNNGVWNNGVTWKNSTDCGLGFGGCLSFDGDGDYVAFGNILNNLEQQMTVSAWTKATNTGSAQVVGKALSTGSHFSLKLAGGNAIFSVCNNATCGGFLGMVNTVSTTKVNDNIWHFLVGSWNNSTDTLKIYVDGKQEGSETSNQDSWSQNSQHHLCIGASCDTNGNGVNFLNGFIDEVAIYNQSLTAYQIRELYAQELSRHQLAQSKF